MSTVKIVVLLQALALGLAFAEPSAAVRCLDDPGDATQIASTRAAIDGACKCFDVASHGDYVRCATGVIDAQVSAQLLRKDCKSTIKKMSAASTCGSDLTRAGSNGPKVVCVTRNVANGRVGCSVSSLCRSSFDGP